MRAVVMYLKIRLKELQIQQRNYSFDGIDNTYPMYLQKEIDQFEKAINILCSEKTEQSELCMAMDGA
ncbi:MAG: hypothetical protein KDC68_06120, partial [Gelidibacter sp.]|nr:hypothetical protein [Gelidibacter sp.]